MIDITLWFLFHRWTLIKSVSEISRYGYQPNRGANILNALHNNNVAGCREYGCIYNDMCNIVRRVNP